MDSSIEVYGQLWPDAQRGPWLLRLRFAAVNGVIECVGLEIRSVRVEGERPDVQITPTRLTGTVLRDLPLGELINAEKRLKRLIFERESYRLQGEAREQATRVAAAWAAAEGPRRGRPSKGLPFYTDVARVYVEASNRGSSPITAVRQWHRRKVGSGEYPTKSAAAKWIHRARKLGLLPPVQSHGEEAQ